MQPKQKTNDPIKNLRDIDMSQQAGGFAEAQPLEGNKNTQPKNVEPPKRTIGPALESKKWSDRFEIAKTYQLPLFQKWAKWYDDMYAHVTNRLS